VTRVEIQPGAVRSVRTHDDVRYHLWVPVSGKLEITIGSSKPVAAASGVFHREGHATRIPECRRYAGAVLEIFVIDLASAAKIQALSVTPGALAKP
jgi:hypothetical protein